MSGVKLWKKFYRSAYIHEHKFIFALQVACWSVSGSTVKYLRKIASLFSTDDLIVDINYLDMTRSLHSQSRMVS